MRPEPHLFTQDKNGQKSRKTEPMEEVISYLERNFSDKPLSQSTERREIKKDYSRSYVQQNKTDQSYSTSHQKTDQSYSTSYQKTDQSY